MRGWGLGTETSALEVSPRERAGGAGWSGDCLGGLETGLSSLMGQRLPWETRKQSVMGGGRNMLRGGKWKATSEGTWEKSLVCTSAGEGREEGVGLHRIPRTPQEAYRPAS